MDALENPPVGPATFIASVVTFLRFGQSSLQAPQEPVLRVVVGTAHFFDCCQAFTSVVNSLCFSQMTLKGIL